MEVYNNRARLIVQLWILVHRHEVRTLQCQLSLVGELEILTVNPAAPKPEVFRTKSTDVIPSPRWTNYEVPESKSIR
jgi:hypothetical protein